MPGLSPWYEGDRIEDLALERERTRPLDPEDVPDVPEEEEPSPIPPGLVRAMRSGPMPQNYDDLLARYSQAAQKISAPQMTNPGQTKDRALLGLGASLTDIAQNVSRVGSKSPQGQASARQQGIFKQEDAANAAARQADMDEFKTLGSMAQLGRGLMNDQAKFQQMQMQTQQKQAGAQAKSQSDMAERDSMEQLLKSKGVNVPPGMSAAALRSLLPSAMKPKDGEKPMTPLQQAQLEFIQARTKKTLEPAGGSEKPFTQDQSNAAVFARNMEQAEADFGDTMGGGYDPTSLKQSFKNSVTPDAFHAEGPKRFKQAERNFINAWLRRVSGAAISEKEFSEGRQQFIPQPGDQPAVLEQKKRNRMQVLEGLKTGAGGAFDKTKLIGAPDAPKPDLQSVNEDEMSDEEAINFALGLP